MENDVNLDQITEELYDFYEKSEKNIETDAIVSRMYVDKTSSEIIDQKVLSQMNSIRASIHQINSKFNENSKSYDQIKEMITNVLAKYKDTLVEYSEFFDGKIEQLILRKYELELNLMYALISVDYYYSKINNRQFQKDNDFVRKSLKENINDVFQRIKGKREENEALDSQKIAKLIDNQDVVMELKDMHVQKIQDAEEEYKDNNEKIESIQRELDLVNKEIEKINNQKKSAITDAMEIGEKYLAKEIRQPKVFRTIKRFFLGRFNTIKMIKSSIIEPLDIRIENFRENDLKFKVE